MRPVEGDYCKDRISGQPNFKNTSFGRLVLFIFTKLTTQNLCSVSIVKRGHLLLPIFGFPQNKMRKYKKYSEEIQKIIGARKGCWNAEKCQNWLRRFKNTKG